MLAISVVGGIAIATILSVFMGFTVADRRGILAGILSGVGLIPFIYLGLLTTRDGDKRRD